MKRLTVTYDGTTIFDADVDSFRWEDGPDGVTVVGKVKGAKPSGGGGLLDLLAGARKQQTAAIVEERKTELDLEAKQ